MKNMADISSRARAEVEEWFPRQCQEPSRDFFWWYRETTPEYDGDIMIASEKPGGSYIPSLRLGRHLTQEQNVYRFLEIARRLPILAKAL